MKHSLTAVLAILVAVCSQREKFKSFLSKKYGETVNAVGKIGDRAIMEFYVSKKGTWTMLMTWPSGRSCMVAAGDNFERLPPEPLGDPS